MPQSLVKNYLHITFSTKNRQPYIDDNIEVELYKYLGGICKNLECYPIIVGGYKDHVHIFCLLSRKMALMKLVEELKSHSSKWIKTKGKQYQKFYWQNGYGGFSVNSTNVDIVKNYILGQKEHHKKRTYKEEYLKLLVENEIKYDDHYIWD
ncbi:MAG: IS200/IS605 family transposase [Bacteroidetes bacterium]|nr:MAG: IS200/IS605 family transposase [Bacteroidota bacterium]